MVLPIIIGAIILGGGAIAIWKGSDTIKPIIDRIFKSKEERELQLQKDQHQHKVNKRGALGNTFAFFFGESAYAETFENKAKQQKPLTGEKKETLSNHRKTTFANNRPTRYSRNG